MYGRWRKLLLLSLMSGIGLSGGARGMSPSSLSPSRWEMSAGIKELYDTPLGTVYQLPYSDKAPWGRFHERGLTSEKLSGQLVTLECELPDFPDDDDSQYMIVEFSVRVFPAISRVKNPNLHLGVGVANWEGVKAGGYKDIIWMDELHSGCSMSGYHVDKCPLCGVLCYGHSSPMSYLNAASKTPYYEPEKYRFVFSCFSIWEEKNHGAINLRCPSCEQKRPAHRFVIFIPQPSRSSVAFDKDPPRTIIEVSEPGVYFSATHPDAPKDDSVATKKKTILFPVKVLPRHYPYGSYELPSQKMIRQDNPDQLYAYALKLQQYDPPRAQQLFEKLSGRKFEHVLAMYKAGFGYWRGIGVAPDWAKAEVLLKKAAGYGLPQAVAALAEIRLTRLPVEVRLGLPNYGPELQKKINHTCIPKFGDELSFVCRLLRLMPRNELLEINGPKNQLMAAISRTGNLTVTARDITVTARDIYPEITATGAFYLAAGNAIAARKPEEAGRLFAAGAKMGNRSCELELLRLQVEKQKLPPSYFTPETDLKYGDYPLYYLLQYAVKNKQPLAIEQKVEDWKKHGAHAADLPTVLVFLYDFYTRDFRNSKSKIFLGIPSGKLEPVILMGEDGQRRKVIPAHDIFSRAKTIVAMLMVANRQLENIARQGDRDALYLLGLQYLNGQRTGLSSIGDSDHLEKINAANFFRAAAKKGHLKAGFMAIKMAFESNGVVHKEWLEQLAPYRDLNYGPAWLLSAQIEEKLAGKNPKDAGKIMATYHQAAALGANYANYCLGDIFYHRVKTHTGIQDDKLVVSSDPNMVKALEYWREFQKNDENERAQDPFDYYYSAIGTRQ
ncbi:MAG: SEL1-like repeat protein [Victivallales bacterium]|nr:SEL1-like repeat protein [Victivallales bacterium]